MPRQWLCRRAARTSPIEGKGGRDDVRMWEEGGGREETDDDQKKVHPRRRF